MTVTRKGNLDKVQAKLENAQRRGLILGAQLVAQRATDRAHVISGRLKRSITHDIPQKQGRGVMVVRVGTNVEYAEEEEFRPGTKHGTPHSYLRPAINESREDIAELIAKNIVAALK